MYKLFLILMLSTSLHAENVKDFGAFCDGVADDTASIQSAINATMLNGGVLNFDAGTCMISSTLFITNGISIKGEGRQATKIKWLSKSLNGLSINTDRMVNISDIGFNAPLDSTSGDMITITGATANSFSTIKNSTFIGGFNQLKTLSAYAFVMDSNYHYGYTNSAAHISNVYNPDWGDSTIVNSTFSGGGASSSSIIQKSSGGLRVVNNKFLGGAYAYRLWLSNNELTSDFIFNSNSVENQTIAALSFGTSNNGALFANIVINGNQFMNQPSVILMNSEHKFMSRVVISNNSMSVVSMYGIIISSVDDFVISDNQIQGHAALNAITINANSLNGRVSSNLIGNFNTPISNASPSTIVTN